MVGIGTGSVCNIGDSEVPWTMDDTVWWIIAEGA